jgi:hypothetical protein
MFSMFWVSCNGAQMDSAGPPGKGGRNEVGRAPSRRKEAESPGSVDPGEDVPRPASPEELEERGDAGGARDPEDQAQKPQPEEAEDEPSSESDGQAKGELPELHPGPDQDRLIQLLVAALSVHQVPLP